MNLYIEIENGLTKNHPALEGNLLQAFGLIPPNWEPFVRVTYPFPSAYEVVVHDRPVYAKVNGVWTDVWAIRNMTAEEKATKQQKLKDDWASLPDRDNYSAWAFEEETCTYQPPIPRPKGRQVFWQGTTNSWVDLPEYPTDDKQYKLDYASATWVLVQP